MITATDPKDVLGLGLYTLPEAAMFARVSTQLLSRWMFGARRGKAVFAPQIGEFVGERVASFLDFVQALALRSIRNTRKIPLQTVRKAVKFAEREYGVQYPLARKHTVFVFGRDTLVINLGDQKSKKYVQLTGRHKRNIMMEQVIELYLEELSFDAEGLATRYCAYSWKDYEITMDPHVRFGEPLVSSCGYSAQALFDAYVSEGGFEAAAEAYGVQQDEVRLACKYFDILDKSAN